MCVRIMTRNKMKLKMMKSVDKEERELRIITLPIINFHSNASKRIYEKPFHSISELFSLNICILALNVDPKTEN